MNAPWPLAPRRRSAADLSPAAAMPLAFVRQDRIAVVARPDRAAVDGYLRLAVRLLLDAQRLRLRTVGVVSLHGGEGKTTVALNLAACLGRTRGLEGRVLLLDADVRSRTLSRLLCGETAARRLDALLTATPFDNVDLLTAPTTRDEATLFSPGAWRDVVRDLAQRYAHVIVDGASVLTSPHAAAVLDAVEALVFVVRRGKTDRRLLRRTADQLGRPILGVVLSDAGGPPSRARRERR